MFDPIPADFPQTQFFSDIISSFYSLLPGRSTYKPCGWEKINFFAGCCFPIRIKISKITGNLGPQLKGESALGTQQMPGFYIR